MKVCPSNHMICMPQCAGYVQGNVQHRFLLFHFYFSISRRIGLEYYQFALLDKNRVFQRDRRFAGSQPPGHHHISCHCLHFNKGENYTHNCRGDSHQSVMKTTNRTITPMTSLPFYAKLITVSLYNCNHQLNIETYKGLGGSMSYVVGLPNNSNKPIINTACIRDRLCTLQKGALDSQPQELKPTSCLPMVGGFLRVLRLLPSLKLFSMLQLNYC